MLRLFARVETWIMLALGFSAGLPLLLVYGTLSTWLREAGVDVKAIGWFSLVGLAFGFKFLWAPIIDRLPCPVLSARLGQRRGWLLGAQLLLVFSFALMSTLDPTPAHGTGHIASLFVYGALIIAIAAATQDIVIDAVRVELAEREMQAWLSGVYIAGYRVGMIVSGAGALYLATLLGSSAEYYSLEAWQTTYRYMSFFVLVGIITTFLISEPKYSQPPNAHPTRDYLVILAVFALCLGCFFFLYTGPLAELGNGMKAIFVTDDSPEFARAVWGFVAGTVRFLGSAALAFGLGVVLSRSRRAPRVLIQEMFVTPFADLLTRFGKTTLLILLVIASFRLTDVLMGVLANPFYIDTGFTKTEIATVSKVFGLFITIVGGFVGGWLTKARGIFTGMLVGGFLAAMTNLAFSWLAGLGPELYGLYIAIGIDNLAGGMASAAFVAFLSALINRAFTATQYATLFALTSIFPKIVAAKSGEWVEQMGYANFFTMTAVFGLPTLVFLVLLNRARPSLMSGNQEISDS
jgi:PAT family beta-lactamase induction signal transducer AmpG